MKRVSGLGRGHVLVLDTAGLVQGGLDHGGAIGEGDGGNGEDRDEELHLRYKKIEKSF